MGEGSTWWEWARGNSDAGVHRHDVALLVASVAAWVSVVVMLSATTTWMLYSRPTASGSCGIFRCDLDIDGLSIGNPVDLPCTSRAHCARTTQGFGAAAAVILGLQVGADLSIVAWSHRAPQIVVDMAKYCRIVACLICVVLWALLFVTFHSNFGSGAGCVLDGSSSLATIPGMSSGFGIYLGVAVVVVEGLSIFFFLSWRGNDDRKQQLRAGRAPSSPGARGSPRTPCSPGGRREGRAKRDEAESAFCTMEESLLAPQPAPCLPDVEAGGVVALQQAHGMQLSSSASSSSSSPVLDDFARPVGSAACHAVVELPCQSRVATTASATGDTHPSFDTPLIQ